MSDELDFERLARESEQELGPDAGAPARLLSLTYTALIEAQQVSGPLLDVTATKAAGSPLCVFEELVQITPAGQQMKPVLEVRQIPRSGRREGRAEWIALDRLAETVPQSRIPPYEQVDSDCHSKRCSRVID